MSWLRTFGSRLGGLFHKSSQESELTLELREHIELLTEENILRGMPSSQARHAALRAFGGVEQIKEAYRDRRSLPFVETLLQDLRYAARSLRRNPAFTAVAGLTLALGMGANTAIFSYAELTLTRPVALPGLDRLISVVERRPPSHDDEPMSVANYLDLAAACKSVEHLDAYQPWKTTMREQNEPVAIHGVRATGRFFETVGVKAAIGRSWLPEEQEPGRARVVVLSDGFWRRKFGADPAALGQILQLDEQSYTVIGVMPANYKFPLGEQSFWTPLALNAVERSQRGDGLLFGIGRLRAGTQVEQARAELATLWNGLEKQYPRENGPYRATVLKLQDHLVNEDSRPFVVLLVAVAGFVLLIACANAANLQLARAAGRRREIGLRTALGAGRWRIMRQLLTESVVLATVGGALGLLLAVWGVNVLRTTMPPELAWICDLESLHLNARAIAFTFVLAVAAGVLSGLAPAWQNSRAELNDALKEGTGRTTGGQSHQWRQAFVVAEVALALILLIGAGLMVKGFAALATPSPEIEARNLLTFTINLPVSKYRETYQVRAFYTQVLEKLQALAEIQSVAVITGLPYSFYDNTVSVRVEGQAPVPANQLPTAMKESISRGYLRTMHIPLRQGREFDDRDTAEAPAVAVISDSMARRLWPGNAVIGRRVKLGEPGASGPWVTIVGVAGDTRHEVYDRSFRSVLYRPFQQDPPQTADFAIRTQGDPAQLSGAVRAALIQVDRNLPAERIESMEEKVHWQASGLRYIAGLMAVFGLAALVLASVGVYGVMAYSVNERRREIGIRMALGASPAAVLRAVMTRGVALTAGGLAVGTPLALVLAKFMSSLIYGVSAWDASTFIGVPLALAAIAMTASYVPALRATRVDPLVALHYD